MAPPRSSSGAHVPMSPALPPPYKSEEDEQEHEENVGLLSATSNRLQHITSRKFSSSSGKSSRSQSAYLHRLLVPLIFLAAIVMGTALGGSIGYVYARGAYYRDDGGGSGSQGSTATTGTGKTKLSGPLAGELNGLVPECESYLASINVLRGGEYQNMLTVCCCCCAWHGIVEVKPFVFGKDPLATSDHKTEASENATEENWRSYMPGMLHLCLSSMSTLPSSCRDGWWLLAD